MLRSKILTDIVVTPPFWILPRRLLRMVLRYKFATSESKLKMQKRRVSFIFIRRD